MIIESLIRLGSPFLGQSGLSPEEVITHITDVVSSNTRNFFQNVCLVEMDAASDGGPTRIEVHPVSMWGDWIPQESGEGAASKSRSTGRKPREIFKQDSARAVGIPFAMPSGGNPLARQGCYPVPVYIVYERSLSNMAGNKEEILKFVQARASFTIGWTVTDEELEILASGVSSVLPRPKKGSDKTMAIIAVVDYRTGLYSHLRGSGGHSGRQAFLGESRMYPGQTIVANLGPIVDNLWEARLREAEEKGSLPDGKCSFCGTRGRTVSSYAKAWPFFSTTYSYPLPMELKESELVKSIGLCPTCYRALVFGANLLYKTQQKVDYTITKELFSPTQSVQGKMNASTVPTVRSIQNYLLYTSSAVLQPKDCMVANTDGRGSTF